MRESGISEADIERIVWQNPVAFFSQSGRLDLGPAAASPAIDQTQLWEGNSVLRGQQPIVKR
jgi:hypothetical protein